MTDPSRTSATTWSSLGGGPVAVIPNELAAIRYFFTVSRASPVARAMPR
jgi:hypothetical protein